jgi:hypothetical protein
VNESGAQIANLHLGNCISDWLARFDLRVSWVFLRQCIFRSAAEALNPQRVVLVSLVFDSVFGRNLHDGVAVPYTPQALWQFCGNDKEKHTLPTTPWILIALLAPNWVVHEATEIDEKTDSKERGRSTRKPRS